MNTKRCVQCSADRPIDEYRRPDGKSHGAKCKACRYERYKKWRKTPKGRQHVMRYSRSEGPGLARQRYRERHPEKYKAAIKFHHARERGIIKKQPCVICGAPKAHGHHPDYKKPLEVIWLCPPHHKAEHKRIQMTSPARMR